VHQLGDGVERVEEEMGLELHLEHLELRGRQLGLELGGAQLQTVRLIEPLLIPAVVVDRMHDRHDHEVGEHGEIDLHQPLHQEGAPGGHRRADDHPPAIPDPDVHDRGEQRHDQVQGQVAVPGVAIDSETADEGDDRRGEHDPQRHVRHQAHRDQPGVGLAA